MDDLTAVVRDLIDQSPAVRKESLHTDFPPWSREMAALVRLSSSIAITLTRMGHIPPNAISDAMTMETIFRAAFPETKNAE